MAIDNATLENWSPSLMGLAGVIEVLGGALFLIGLFTRPVAGAWSVDAMRRTRTAAPGMA